jgi:hypothetical protein
MPTNGTSPVANEQTKIGPRSRMQPSSGMSCGIAGDTMSKSLAIVNRYSTATLAAQFSFALNNPGYWKVRSTQKFPPPASTFGNVLAELIALTPLGVSLSAGPCSGELSLAN